MEEVVLISSGSEDDEITASLKKKNDKYFKQIWAKVKDLIFTSSRGVSDSNFPHHKFVDLCKELQKCFGEIRLTSMKAFLWKSLLQWIHAMKLSYDGIKDLKYDDKFNLTLVDLMAQYINYKCKKLKQQIVVDQISATEIDEDINETLTNLHVLFNGNTPYIVMTLLKVDVDKEYAKILYPIFRKFLSNKHLHQSNEIISYLRLVLCYKQWKKMVPVGVDKEEINVIAQGILPASVPSVDSAKRPFANISDVIDFAKTKGKHGTRILLTRKSFDLEEAIKKYFKQYESYISRGDTSSLCRSTKMLSLADCDPLEPNKENKKNLTRVREIWRPPRKDRSTKKMTSPSSKNSHKHLSKPCDNSIKLNSSSKSKKVCNYSASNSINLSRNTESNKVKNTYKVADVIELSSSDENTANESARKIELVPSYKKQPKSVSNRLTKQQSHSSSSKVLADSEKTPQSKVLRNAQHKKFRKKVPKSTQNVNYSSDSDDSPVNAKKVIRNKLVRRTVRSVSSDSYASDYDNIDTRKKFGERVLQVNRTLTNLKKTKQPCIQGEVSSTTFPDIHIPTPDQQATSSVQCPQSSLEVHSSSNLQDFQNGREVGSGVLQILKTPSPDIREKVFMNDPNRPNLSTMTYTDYESLYRDMVRAEQKSVERPCIANFNSNLNYHRELLPYECGPLRLRNFQSTFPISPRESNVDGETKKLNDGSAVRNETVTKEKIEDSDKSTSLCATSSNQLPFLKKSLATRTELGVSAIGRKSISQKDKFIQTEIEEPLHTSVPCSTPLETTTSTADIENTEVEGITSLLTKQTELVTAPGTLAVSKSPNKEINSVLSSTCGIEEKIKSTSCSPSSVRIKSSTQPNNTKRNNAMTIAPSIEEVRTEILPLQHSHTPENIEIETCSSTLTSKDLSGDDCLSVSINDNVNSSNKCVEQSFPLESNKSLEISCKNQQIAKDDSGVCNERATKIIENKQKNANYLRVKDVSALQCPVEKSKNICMETSLPSSEVQIPPKNSTESLDITNNTPTQTSSDKEIKQNFSIEIKNRMEMLIEEEICNVKLDEYGDSIGAEEENALLCEDESILKENDNPVEPTHTDNQIAMKETDQESTKKCESDFNSVDATENDKTEAFLRILDKCLEEDTLQGDIVSVKESSSCLEIEKVGESLPLSYSSCATDKADTNSSSCTKKDKICAQSVTVGDLQNKDEIFSPKETFSVESKGESKDDNEQKNKQQNNVCNIIATPSKDSETLRYIQTDESKEKHEECCAKIQTVTNDDMKNTCEKQMSPLKESSTIAELATMVVESCGESKGVIPDTQEKSTNDEETNSQADEAMCSVQQTSNDDSEESISRNNDSLKEIETNENVQEVISEVEAPIKDDKCVAKTDSLFMSQQTVALIHSEPKQETTTNSDLSFDHDMTIASTENASMYEEQNISSGNKDARKDSCESEKSSSTSTCAMDNILEKNRSVNEQHSSLTVNIEIEEKSKETVDVHFQDPEDPEDAEEAANTKIDEKVQKTCSDTYAQPKTLSDTCIEISVKNGISAGEKPKGLLEDESNENNKESFASVEAVNTGIKIAIEEEVSIDDQRGNALMCCEINENFQNVSYEVEIDSLSNVNTAVINETNHVFASELASESIVEETPLNRNDGKSTAECDSEIAKLSLEKEESILTPVMTRENIKEDKNDDREKENKHVRNCDDDNKHEESFPSNVLIEKQIHVVETTKEHLDESISKISAVLDDSCGEIQKTQDENGTIETEFDKAVFGKIKVTSEENEFCDKKNSTKEEDGAVLLHESENKSLNPKDIDDEISAGILSEKTTCTSDNVVDTVLVSTSNREKDLTVGENNDQLMEFQTCGDSSKNNLEEQSEVQNVIVQISKHETEPSQDRQTNFPQMTVDDAKVQCIHNELSVSHLYGETSEAVEQNKEILAENMEATTEIESFCQNETLKSIQLVGELEAKDSNEDNGNCKIKPIIPDIETEQTVETDVSCAATEVRDTECQIIDHSEVEVFDYSVEDNNCKVGRKLTVIEYGKKFSQLLAENVDQNPAYSSVIVEKIEEANETITEVNRCKEFEKNFPDDKEEQEAEDVNPVKQTKTNNTVMPEYANTEEIQKQEDSIENLDKIGTKINDECTSLKIIEENTEIVQNENQNSARGELLMLKQSETRIEATVEQDLTKQHDAQGMQEENATEDSATISLLKSSKSSANVESITKSSDAPDALQNISPLQNRPTVLTTIASCAAENDTREREFPNFSKDDSDKKSQVDAFKLSFDQKSGNDFSSRCERDYLGKIGKAVRQSGGSMNKMLTHDKIVADADQSKLCSIDENSGKLEEQPKDGCPQFNSEFICPSNDVCSNFFLRSKKSIPNEKALIKSPEENYERTPFKLRIKRRLSECANNLENLLNEDKCSPCKSNIPPTAVNDARSECEIFPIKAFASEPNKEEAPVENKLLTPEIDSNCENSMNNAISGVGRIKTDHLIKNNIKSSTIRPTSCNETLSSDETEVDIEKQQVWMNKLGLRKKPNEKLPLTREESKEKKEKGRLNKLIISRRETTTSTGVVDTFTSRINAVAENTSDTTKKGETVSLGPSYNLTLLASEAEKLTPIVDAISPTANEPSKSPRSGLRSGTTQSKRKGKSLRSTRNSCTEVEKEEIELNVRNALQVVQNKPKSALKNPNSKQRKERRKVTFADTLGVWKQKKMTEFLKLLRNSNGRLQLTSNLKDKLSEVLMILSEYSKEYDIRPSELCIKNEEFVVDMMFDEPELYKEEVSKKGLKTSKKIAPKKDIEQVIGELILKTLQKNKALDQLTPPKIDYEQGMKIIQNSAVVEYIEPGTSTMQLDLVDDRDQPTLQNEDTQKIVDDSSELSLIIKTPASKRGRKPKINNQKSVTANDKKCDDIKSKKIVGGNKKQSASLNLSQLLYPASEAMARSKDQFADITVISDHESSDESLSDYLYKTNQYLNAVLDNKPLDLKNNSLNVRDTARNAGKYVQSFPNATPLLSPNNFMSVSIGQCTPAQTLDKKKTKKSSKKEKREAQPQEVTIAGQRTCENTKQVTSTVEAMANTVVTEAKFKTLLEPEIIIENASGNVNLNKREVNNEYLSPSNCTSIEEIVSKVVQDVCRKQSILGLSMHNINSCEFPKSKSKNKKNEVKSTTINKKQKTCIEPTDQNIKPTFSKSKLHSKTSKSLKLGSSHKNHSNLKINQISENKNLSPSEKSKPSHQIEPVPCGFPSVDVLKKEDFDMEGNTLFHSMTSSSPKSSESPISNVLGPNNKGIDGNILPFNLSLGTDNAICQIKEDTKEEDISVKTDVSIKLCEDPINSQDSTESSSQNSTTNQLIDALVPICERKSEKLVGSKKRKSKRCKQLTSDIIINKNSYNECFEGASKITQPIVNKPIEPSDAASRTPPSNNGLDLIQPGAIREPPSDATEISCIPHRILNNKKEGKIPSVRKSKKVGLLDMVEMLNNSRKEVITTERETEENENIFVQTKALDLSAKIKPQSELPQENSEINTTSSGNKNLLQEITMSNKKIFTPQANLEVADTSKSTCNELKTIDENVGVVANSMVCLNRKEDVNEVSDEISITPEKESLLESVSDIVSKGTTEPNTNKDEISVGETTSDSITNPMNTENQISMTPEKESLLYSVSASVSEDTVQPNTNKNEIMVGETTSDSTMSPMNAENQISMTPEKESLLDSVSDSVSKDTAEPNTNNDEIKVGETTSDSTAENEISTPPEKESLLDSVSDSVSEDTVEPNTNKDKVKVGETTSDSTINPMNTENQISMTPEKESLLDSVSDSVSEDTAEPKMNKDEIEAGETASDSTKSIMNTSCKNEEDEGETKMLDMDKMERKIPADSAEDQYDRENARKELSGETYIAQTSETNNEITENNAEDVLRANMSSTEVSMESNQNAPILDERTYIIEDAINKQQSGEMEKPIDTEQNQEDSKNVDEVTKNTETSEEPILNAVEVPINVVSKMPVATKASKKDMTQVLKIMETIKENEINQADRKIEDANKISLKIIDDTNLKSDSNMILTSNEISTDSQYPPEERKLKSIKLKITNRKDKEDDKIRSRELRKQQKKNKKRKVIVASKDIPTYDAKDIIPGEKIGVENVEEKLEVKASQNESTKDEMNVSAQCETIKKQLPESSCAPAEPEEPHDTIESDKNEDDIIRKLVEPECAKTDAVQDSEKNDLSAGSPLNSIGSIVEIDSMPIENFVKENDLRDMKNSINPVAESADENLDIAAEVEVVSGDSNDGELGKKVEEVPIEPPVTKVSKADESIPNENTSLPLDPPIVIDNDENKVLLVPNEVPEVKSVSFQSSCLPIETKDCSESKIAVVTEPVKELEADLITLQLNDGDPKMNTSQTSTSTVETQSITPVPCSETIDKGGQSIEDAEDGIQKSTDTLSKQINEEVVNDESVKSTANTGVLHDEPPKDLIENNPPIESSSHFPSHSFIYSDEKMFLGKSPNFESCDLPENLLSAESPTYQKNKIRSMIDKLKNECTTSTIADEDIHVNLLCEKPQTAAKNGLLSLDPSRMEKCEKQDLTLETACTKLCYVKLRKLRNVSSVSTAENEPLPKETQLLEDTSRETEKSYEKVPEGVVENKIVDEELLKADNVKNNANKIEHTVSLNIAKKKTRKRALHSLSDDAEDEEDLQPKVKKQATKKRIVCDRWENEERLISKYTNLLQLKKMFASRLMQFLCTFERLPTLEVFFTFNKFLVTFIYETLSSEDYSTVSCARTYLHLCTKTKQLQSKNIDDIALDEIEQKYTLLKKKRNEFRSLEKIKLLDEFLQQFKLAKKTLFTDIWIRKNYSSIQRHLHMEPVELHFNAEIPENVEYVTESNEVAKILSENNESIQETAPNSSIQENSAAKVDSLECTNVVSEFDTKNSVAINKESSEAAGTTEEKQEVNPTISDTVTIGDPNTESNKPSGEVKDQNKEDFDSIDVSRQSCVPEIVECDDNNVGAEEIIATEKDINEKSPASVDCDADIGSPSMLPNSEGDITSTINNTMMKLIQIGNLETISSEMDPFSMTNSFSVPGDMNSSFKTTDAIGFDENLDNSQNHRSEDWPDLLLESIMEDLNAQKDYSGKKKEDCMISGRYDVRNYFPEASLGAAGVLSPLIENNMTELVSLENENMENTSVRASTDQSVNMNDILKESLLMRGNNLSKCEGNNNGNFVLNAVNPFDILVPLDTGDDIPSQSSAHISSEAAVVNFDLNSSNDNNLNALDFVDYVPEVVDTILTSLTLDTAISKCNTRQPEIQHPSSVGQSSIGQVSVTTTNAASALASSKERIHSLSNIETKTFPMPTTESVCSVATTNCTTTTVKSKLVEAGSTVSKLKQFYIPEKDLREASTSKANSNQDNYTTSEDTVDVTKRKSPSYTKPKPPAPKPQVTHLTSKLKSHPFPSWKTVSPVKRDVQNSIPISKSETSNSSKNISLTFSQSSDGENSTGQANTQSKQVTPSTLLHMPDLETPQNTTVSVSKRPGPHATALHVKKDIIVASQKLPSPFPTIDDTQYICSSFGYSSEVEVETSSPGPVAKKRPRGTSSVDASQLSKKPKVDETKTMDPFDKLKSEPVNVPLPNNSKYRKTYSKPTIVNTHVQVKPSAPVVSVVSAVSAVGSVLSSKVSPVREIKYTESVKNTLPNKVKIHVTDCEIIAPPASANKPIQSSVFTTSSVAPVVKHPTTSVPNINIRRPQDTQAIPSQSSKKRIETTATITSQSKVGLAPPSSVSYKVFAYNPPTSKSAVAQNASNRIKLLSKEDDSKNNYKRTASSYVNDRTTSSQSIYTFKAEDVKPKKVFSQPNNVSNKTYIHTSQIRNTNGLETTASSLRHNDPKRTSASAGDRKRRHSVNEPQRSRESSNKSHSRHGNTQRNELLDSASASEDPKGTPLTVRTAWDYKPISTDEILEHLAKQKKLKSN